MNERTVTEGEVIAAFNKQGTQVNNALFNVLIQDLFPAPQVPPQVGEVIRIWDDGDSYSFKRFSHFDSNGLVVVLATRHGGTVPYLNYRRMSPKERGES